MTGRPSAADVVQPSETIAATPERPSAPERAQLVHPVRVWLGVADDWIRRYGAALLYCALALGLFAWVTWDAFWVRLITYSPGSDYWEHSATMRALLDDPWHPGNPHVDSNESSPRFVPVFVLSALVARAYSLDALGGMSIATLINTALFLVGIYAFFRVYFQSKVAPLLGLVVMFGSWWNAWHFSNVYQLKIFFSVAGYPSTTALGATLVLFAAAVAELRAPRERWYRLAALAIGWAFVLITHQLTATMTFSGAFILAATLPGVSWRRRLLVGGTVVAGAALAALWPYFSPFEVLRGGTGVNAGWVDRGIESAQESGGGNEGHFFYKQDGLLNTLGLAILGIPVSAYLLIRRNWFIPLGGLAVATPFLANMYMDVPLGHRFILLTIFYLQLAVVWLFLVCLPRRRRSGPGALSIAQHYLPIACVVGILAYFGWTNLEAARGRFDYTERRYRGAVSPYVRLGQRVAEMTGPRAVVLADLRTSWPIPTFGPKVVGLFHTNPLVADEGERAHFVRRFFRSGTRASERLDILRQYRVTHVIVQPKDRAVARFLGARATRRALPGGNVLYTLNPS